MNTKQNLTSEEIKDYIILNFKEKTNTEMGLELGLSKFEVSSIATWLSRKGIIYLWESKNGWVKYVAQQRKLEKLEAKKKEAQKQARKERITKNVTNFNNCVIENVNINNNNVPENEVGNYKNGEGENKIKAKLKMQEHIIATNIQGHIGTLTNLYVDMETAIYNAMPNCSFTTVERELPVYEQIRRNIKSWGIPIKCEFGEFSKILYGKDENTYAHLIMDYCGHLFSVAKELMFTIDNNLVVVGGIIALTTDRVNRIGSGEMWDYITSLSDEKTINRDKDTRSKSEIENERFLYSILGRNYKIIEVFNYRDTHSMTLTIIKRIK